MFHKKAFTFNLKPARLVYDNPERSRSSTTESQESLTQKYLDPKTGAEARRDLYQRADTVLAKARPTSETNTLLKDKVDKLQTRLAAARELEKKNDVFAHEAITIHRFVESIEKIMNPKQVESAKGTPIITTRAETKVAVTEATKPQPKQPDTPKVEVHKTAELSTTRTGDKGKAKTREDKPAANPAESGPKYNVQDQADRYRLYTDNRKLITEVTSALPSADVTRYANILQRQIEKNEAQEKTTDTVGIFTSAILIKNAGKALVALNKGNATPKDLETLKSLEAAEKAPAAKAASEKTAAEKKAATDKAEAERKATADKLAAERRAAAEKAEAAKKVAAEKIEAERKAAADKASKRTLTDKKPPAEKPKDTTSSTLPSLAGIGGTEGPRPIVPSGTPASKPTEALKEQMPDEVMSFFNSKIRPMVTKAAKTENPRPFSTKYKMGDNKTTYYFDITFTQTKDGNAGSIKIRKEVT